MNLSVFQHMKGMLHYYNDKQKTDSNTNVNNTSHGRLLMDVADTYIRTVLTVVAL